MTKQEKMTRVEELEIILNSFYAKRKDIKENSKKEMVEHLQKVLSPKHPIGVNFSEDRIAIFTTVESTTKNIEPPYPDFGSEVEIFNNADFYLQSQVDMKQNFKTTLNYGSMRMDFGKDCKDYQLTKFQILHYVTSEIINEGAFHSLIKNSVITLFELNQEIYPFESEKDRLSYEIKEENTKEFIDSIKSDSWFKKTTTMKKLLLLNFGLFLTFAVNAQTIYVNGSSKGEIQSDGDVYINGSNVGRIESDGDVYKNGSRIGQVESDGDVYYNGSRIGEGKSIRQDWLAGFFFFFFYNDKI